MAQKNKHFHSERTVTTLKNAFFFFFSKSSIKWERKYGNHEQKAETKIRSNMKSNMIRNVFQAGERFRKKSAAFLRKCHNVSQM